jgi:6-phosphogluconate dehydrogenase (decarboxylating)
MADIGRRSSGVHRLRCGPDGFQDKLLSAMPNGFGGHLEKADGK